MNISKYDEKKLLLDIPLYKKIKINITDIQRGSTKEAQYENGEVYYLDVYEEKYPDEFDKLIKFLIYDTPIYAYCDKCKKENSLKPLKIELDKQLLNTTLHGQYVDDFDEYDDNIAKCRLRDRIEFLIREHKYFTKKLICSHNESHELLFIYKLDLVEDYLILQKIGQSPSSLELYNKNLDKKYSKYKNYEIIKSDLNKALISYDNDFSVGGFLYLRRVLEKIIQYKYENVKENLNNQEQESFELNNIKFSDKINILNKYLPKYLTENKCIYSILSKGIHSLTEVECKEYFSIVEKSIYIIIEELIELQEKNNLKKAIEKDLNKINSKIRTK